MVTMVKIQGEFLRGLERVREEYEKKIESALSEEELLRKWEEVSLPLENEILALKVSRNEALLKTLSSDERDSIRSHYEGLIESKKKELEAAENDFFYKYTIELGLGFGSGVFAKTPRGSKKHMELERGWALWRVKSDFHKAVQEAKKEWPFYRRLWPSWKPDNRLSF